MKDRRAARRGYALPLVFIFTVLLLSALGVAWRQVGAVLQIEAVRARQAMRDQGNLTVLAKAMRLLETGLPPENEVSYSTLLNGSPQWYTVTFIRHADDTAVWTVRVVKTNEQSETLMPMTFSP